MKKPPETKVVHQERKHIMSRGDNVKYDATYQFGNTTVHIVAPPCMTAEQIESVLKDHDRVFWHWWNSLSTEEQLRINAECAARKAK